MSDSAVLEELLGPLRAEFHARRRTALARTERLTEALERYNRAIEMDVARQLAAAHGLRHLRDPSDVVEAANALLRAVQALPELAETSTIGEAQPAPPRALPATARAVPQPESRLPALTEAILKSPLVIVGGVPHRERLRQLPDEILKCVEWVDTRQKGTHAIGNLEKRIRDHRISSLILLEGLVQHRHTDPLVSAARSANVPHAYAGKGGTLAIRSALDEIEKSLSLKG
jgi:tetratricopeptide (TPR) repeat protein